MAVESIRLPASPQLARPAYILSAIEVFNWGSFAGRHCASIDAKGTAIIGPTGSGKTTLVDALMTLLTANPRYNLASTGGHESDRDLVTYVRGYSGPGNNSGDNEHIARPGKTVTGIAAIFSAGEQRLCIGAVLAMDDSSSTPADLKKLWIFSQAPDQGLDEWLAAHHEGGVRAVRQLGREIAGLSVHQSKQDYLAQLRRMFEVSENAFTLLNRAAGLKQLNSIDEVFRDLVLDDKSMFDRAAEVASEFDNLATIHAELESARAQQQALIPISQSWTRREQQREQLQVQEQLKCALPVWYAERTHRLAGIRLEKIEQEIQQHEDRIRALEASIDTADKEAHALRDRYMKAGGASIEELRGRVAQQADIVSERRDAAGSYRTLTRRLNMGDALTAEAFGANQQRARELHPEQQALLERQKQETYELYAKQEGHQRELKELETELQQIKARPGSNLPGAYQAFRSELAAHLEIHEDDLPFIAELVEVKAEESPWRGAIERAIGGHRMRVMVPPASMKEALAWVNARDNRLHVRLLEVERSGAAAEFLRDGFTRKLKFKRHAYEAALRRLLASIDRHCVDSPETLRKTPNGMTQQGLMSDRPGRFEKQDQRRLDQDWMTGFDNKDRLATLTAQIKDVSGELQESRKGFEAAKLQCESTEARIGFLKSLLDAQFATIDLPGAQRVMEELSTRLAALTAPDSGAEAAHQRWQEVLRQLQELRGQLSEREKAKAVSENTHDTLELRRQRAFQRVGEGLSDAQRTLADEHLSLPRGDVLDQLEELEREASGRVQARIDSLTKAVQGSEQTLVRQMGDAKKVDNGALAEAGRDIQDVPTYLERLRQLTEEALPEKIKRFLAYLNISSDQGVTQLLSSIDNEVAVIEARIDDLNSTLHRVDFQPGRFLRLRPRRVTHDSLVTLQRSQKRLRTAELQEDQGESHFRALQDMVSLLRDASEKSKNLGARALLDPRHRLRFEVEVIERETGAVIEVRTSSQGGSGGEKEIIASYVLTASLSYALCPDGASRPLFGTVVLDEAFSKSSQAVAGRIIAALHEFGLHPLFVTPNKEMRLLRAHTRSAILIHRKDQRATMTSLSWEELEEHARARSPA